MTALTALAGELWRTYHLADVEPGHPIRRAHDALVAADTELQQLRSRRERAADWHRRMQQAEAACAAAHAGRARTGSMSVGRALANSAAAHWRDRAEAAEAERDALRTAVTAQQRALHDLAAADRAAGLDYAQQPSAEPVAWIAVADKLPANPEWHTGDGPTPDDWVLVYSQTHDWGGTQHGVMRARDFYLFREDDDIDIGTDDSKVVTHWRPLDRPKCSPQPSAEPALVEAATLRPAAAWHEDDGPVLWWRLPVEEPPYVGTPTDSSWPASPWTPIVMPVPADGGGR